jgi:Ala-tRNA(Pro) deacylase
LQFHQNIPLSSICMLSIISQIVPARLQKCGFRSGFRILFGSSFPQSHNNPSAQIHSARLSFAKPEYMEKFLDITPGSVSVLGLMNDTENHVQLLIDEDVLNSEYVGCHPCINTSSLRLRTKDLVETILPAIHHEFVRVKL